MMINYWWAGCVDKAGKFVGFAKGRSLQEIEKKCEAFGVMTMGYLWVSR